MLEPPLGPLFANIFMANFEKVHMNELKNLGINIWLRYVDDIFATLNKPDDVNTILQSIVAIQTSSLPTKKKEKK